MVVAILFTERYFTPDGKEIKASYFLSCKIHRIYSQSGDNSSASASAASLLEIEYLIDHAMEKDVAISRVKLSSTSNEPDYLVQSLYDITHQISLLIPNRKDLQTQLLSSFDSELLSQMIRNDSLSPKSDLLPILTFIYAFLNDLQAEYRISYAKQWFQLFKLCFEKKKDCFENPLFQMGLKKIIPLSSVSSSSSSSSSASSSSSPPAISLPTSNNNSTFNHNLNESQLQQPVSLQDILPILPVYFERLTECIEDIQRDVSDFVCLSCSFLMSFFFLSCFLFGYFVPIYLFI
jgi:hypothetical protein